MTIHNERIVGIQRHKAIYIEEQMYISEYREHIATVNRTHGVIRLHMENVV